MNRQINKDRYVNQCIVSNGSAAADCTIAQIIAQVIAQFYAKIGVKSCSTKFPVGINQNKGTA